MKIADVLDRPIAFHRAFVGIGGGVTGALMLSQAIYWSRRTADDDGWFFKSQIEWTEETGLTRFQQETARRALTLAGVLVEERRGVPARLFYRVDFDALERALDGGSSHTSLRESDNPDCGKPAIRSVGFPQSPKEETTSETTTESTSTRRATRLPDDYVPDLAWAVREGLTEAEAARELARFKDHWSAAPGAKGVKRDWPATWRNWVRSALDRKPQHRRPVVAAREPDGLFALAGQLLSQPQQPHGGFDAIDHQ